MSSLSVTSGLMKDKEHLEQITGDKVAEMRIHSLRNDAKHAICFTEYYFCVKYSFQFSMGKTVYWPSIHLFIIFTMFMHMIKIGIRRKVVYLSVDQRVRWLYST